MSLVITERQMLVATRKEISPRRLTQLSEQIHRAVLNVSEGRHDPLMHEAVRSAIWAFVEEGDARKATAHVAPLLERVGRRQALRGADAAALHECFRVARVVTQRSLTSVIGESITGNIVIRLREELMAYLTLLFMHTRHGLESERQRIQQAQRESVPPKSPALAKGPTVLTATQRRALSKLHEGEQLVVLTAVTEPLPMALCQQAGVAADKDRVTALAPAAWSYEQLCEWLEGQAVLGPGVTAKDASGSVSLVRRAAVMLAEGSMYDARRLVPFEDLLGSLLVASNPVLNKLMIAKHFSGWESLPRSRRVALGDFLQLWLERGQPTNQLARELGIPPQTAHSRQKAVRQLLGDALDDPTQRLEIMVALRALLPTWRN